MNDYKKQLADFVASQDKAILEKIVKEYEARDGK
jgi:hypothetical protein